MVGHITKWIPPTLFFVCLYLSSNCNEWKKL